YTYAVVSGDDVAKVAKGLVNRINNTATGYKAALAAGDATSLFIWVDDPFNAGFAVTPDTDGTAAVSANGNAVTVELGGDPTEGEVWTLTLGASTFAYTVEFRDDLAT